MNEIKTRLASVIDVLNTIEVKGKANLVNLGGCIAFLEDFYRALPDDNEEQNKTE